LVALNGARDKGRVGAGLTFSSYNYHAFGADAVLQMDFNTGTAVNQSQYNFTTPTVGLGVTYSNFDSPTGNGYSANFGGNYATSFIRMSITNPVSISDDVSSIKFTASAWIKPSVLSGDGFILVSGPNCSWSQSRTISLFWLASAGGKLQIWNNDVTTTSVLAVAGPSIWTNIAYTWNGSKYSFYINGTFIESITPTLNGNPGTKFIGCIGIGNYYANIADYPFTGKIDDVAIYTQSLTASAIQQIYAAGLPTHTVAVK